MNNWPDAFELASEAVKDCAESVAEDNPDLSKSQAFAVCQDMANEGKLEGHDPDQHEQSAYVQPFRALATDHDMSPPGPVRRQEQDNGSVRYTNLLILGPGEWTDAASGETIFYAPELMETLAAEAGERVVRTNVNLNHESRDQLLQVGNFDADSLETDQHGNLYSDVILHGRTSASEDAIGLMDLALETEGEQGAGGLSVEIPFENEVIEFDKERGMKAMTAGDLSGLGIVTDAASAPASFQEQLAERSIAMSTAGESVRALSRGETDLNGHSQPDDMDTRIELIQRALAAEDGVEITIEGQDISDIQDALGDDPSVEEIEEHLEGPDEPEQDLEEGEEEFDIGVEDAQAAISQEIEQRAGDDMSPDEARAEIVDELASASGRDESTINAILSGDIDAVPDEVVQAMADVLDVDMEDLGSDIEEEEEEEENSGHKDDEEMEALSELKEEVRELREDKEEMETRIEELENEPVEKREFGASDDSDGEESGAMPVKGGLSRDGGYVTR